MKHKENRIGRVLALKRKLSLQAKGALEEARQEMMKAAEIDKQRARNLTALGKKVVAFRERSARDLHSAAELFERARLERQEAKKLLEEAEAMVGERRDAVLSLEREIKSLEHVASRLRVAREKEMERKAQRFLDEVGARASQEKRS